MLAPSKDYVTSNVTCNYVGSGRLVVGQ